MDLQDKVYVSHYIYPNVNNIKCKIPFTFYNSYEYYDKYSEIKENESWILTFKGNPHDKLYIDGLNLLDDNNIKKDENGELYISPSIEKQEVSINLYRPASNSESEASGYLPGNFLLKLVTSNSKIVYSWLKVNPKLITNNDLSVMRKEIDKIIKGLTFDYRSGYFGSESLNYKYITFNDLETLAILHSNKKKFLINFQELLLWPKMKINLNYAWTKDEVSLLDQISVKEMTKHPEKNKQVYSKNRTITSNLLENFDLKRNLIFLDNRITKLVQHVNEELTYRPFSKDSFLAKDKTIANLYLGLLNYLLNVDWLKTIKPNCLYSQNVLTSDPRYIFIKKLVNKIQHSNYHKLKFSRQYNYYWKRTELLYEIWGYLKVIESMINIGFKIKSGWIFDSNIGKIVSLLKDGTTIDMVFGNDTNEKLNAQVIYNKEIKGFDADSAEINDPIWCSGTHNKPDIRINIYDSEMILVYIIVLDSKYRKLNSNTFYDTWEQLNSYSNSFYSEYPDKSHKYRINEGMSKKPIDTATFILYPKHETEKIDKKFKRGLADGRIKAVGLVPDARTSELEIYLKQCIDTVEKWISKNHID